MPDTAIPAVLRPGGGLRRAAVLQYVHAVGGADHHGESGVCRTAAQAVPQGIFPEIRPAAGEGRAGKADLPHHRPGQAGADHQHAGVRPPADHGAARQLWIIGG